MRAAHFALYSSIKQALNEDFKHFQGRDLLAFIRSVGALKRRFEVQTRLGEERAQLNGTELVLGLLGDRRLLGALEVLESSEGRQLVDLYRGRVNGREQNLACSEWRVREIEAAAARLAQEPRLAAVFSGAHRSFVERSARKCLRSACKTVNDNMSQLDLPLKQRTGTGSRRRLSGGVAQEFAKSTGAAAAAELEAGETGGLEKEADREKETERGEEKKEQQQGLVTATPDRGDERAEFYEEELELCRFFKRTNSSACQASGRELSQLSFVRADERPTTVGAGQQQATEGQSDGANMRSSSSRLAELLADYERVLSARPTRGPSAERTVLLQCRAMRPTLEHSFAALRWYTRNGALRPDKLESRAAWCPSLSYWLELDRLCGELETQLAPRDSTGLTFAY